MGFTKYKMNKNKYVSLNEALSSFTLDDIEDFDDADDIQIQSSDVKGYDPLVEFIEKRIIKADGSPLTNTESQIVSYGIPSNHNYTYTPVDPIELRDIVNRSIMYFGNNVNLNWLDTSNITSMLMLFMNKANFNGDISGWDVSNVRNMMHIFEGCKSLECDLSAWNPTSLKFWNKDSYKGVSPTMKKQCEAFAKKAKNLVLRKL